DEVRRRREPFEIGALERLLRVGERQPLERLSPASPGEGLSAANQSAGRGHGMPRSTGTRNRSTPVVSGSDRRRREPGQRIESRSSPTSKRRPSTSADRSST